MISGVPNFPPPSPNIALCIRCGNFRSLPPESAFTNPYFLTPARVLQAGTIALGRVAGGARRKTAFPLHIPAPFTKGISKRVSANPPFRPIVCLPVRGRRRLRDRYGIAPGAPACVPEIRLRFRPGPQSAFGGCGRSGFRRTAISP